MLAAIRYFLEIFRIHILKVDTKHVLNQSSNELSNPLRLNLIRPEKRKEGKYCQRRIIRYPLESTCHGWLSNCCTASVIKLVLRLFSSLCNGQKILGILCPGTVTKYLSTAVIHSEVCKVFSLVFCHWQVRPP